MELNQLNYKNDVNYIKNFVGKNVNVLMKNNVSHIGTVYVIDPQTKIIVLLKDDSSLCFLLPHAIKSIEDDMDNANKFGGFKNFDTQESLIKKLHVKTWLEKNFVQVKEDGNLLKIDDELIVKPPYGPEQCISKTEGVLIRIKNILSQIPYYN